MEMDCGHKIGVKKAEGFSKVGMPDLTYSLLSREESGVWQRKFVEDSVRSRNDEP